MNYEIGDTVVHWTHGLGKVIAIDEMHVAGIMQKYYVVEAELLKLWIPIEEGKQCSIRLPTQRVQFMQLIRTLQTPADQLTDNPFKRKIELRGRIQERTLSGLCNLIRDLTERSHRHSLNQNDSAVLFRAEEYLLDEWVLSLGTERESAKAQLDVLLRGEPSGIDG